MQRWSSFVEQWWALCDRTAKARQVLGVVLPPLVLVGWISGIARTGRWPAGDGPHVLGIAMRLAQQLRDLDLGTFAYCFNVLLAPHPPGAYVPATLAYTVLGTEVAWAHLAAAGGVMWFIWDGMRRLGGGPWSALWLAACSGVWLQAELYGIDFVASACVIQSLSHLAVSEGLGKRIHVIGWAAWMGAAFLTKYTAPFFLVAPCLVAGFWVIRHRRFKAFGIALGVFAVVALPWWGPHIDEVLRYVQSSSDVNNEQLTNKATLTEWNLDRFSWYLAVLADNLGWLGVAGAAVALGAWPRRRDLPAATWLIPTVAILSAYFILCAQTQRQSRYLTPMLPLIAAVAGSARIRWVIAAPAAIGAYGAAMVYLAPEPAPVSRAFVHDLSTAGDSWPWPPEALSPMSLDPGKWDLDEALTRVREVHGSDEGTVGFMLAEENGAPPVGLVVYRAGTLGYRWHVSSPNTRDRGGNFAFYVMPFAAEDWPDRDFDVLLAMTREGDSQRSKWLQRYGLESVESWRLDERLSVSIWQRARPIPSSGQ